MLANVVGLGAGGCVDASSAASSSCGARWALGIAIRYEETGGGARKLASAIATIAGGAIIIAAAV